MSSESSRRAKQARLSCRIDADLKEWIQWYANLKGTTVSEMIDSHFRGLRRNYRNRNKVKVEQI